MCRENEKTNLLGTSGWYTLKHSTYPWLVTLYDQNHSKWSVKQRSVEIFFSANERTWTCELGFLCHSDQYDATIVRSRSREYFRWDRETIRVKIEEAYGFWRRWRENTELTQSEDDQETAAMNAGDGDCDRIGDMLPTPTDPNTRIKVKISLSLAPTFLTIPKSSEPIRNLEPNRTEPV